MFRKALAVRKKLEGNESAAIVYLLSQLGANLGREYKDVESVAMTREALAMAKKLYAKNPERGMRIHIFYESINLGEGVSRLGEFDEAENLAREALAMLDGSADFGYVEREFGLLAYSRILHAEGKAAEAETASREVLVARIKRSGPEGLGVAQVERSVADALLDQDKLDEAEKRYRHCIRIYGILRTNYASLNCSTALKRLGEVLRKRGNLPEAEKYMRESLAMRIQIYEASNPVVLDTRQELFQLLCEEGKYPEARTELEEWLKGERLRCAAKPALLTLGVGQMADFLYAREKTNEAAPFYREVMEICLPALHEDDVPSLGNVAWFQATCLAPAFRNPTNAVRLGEKAVQITVRKHPELLGVLAAAYAANGQFERAVAVQKEASHLPQEATAKAESAARLALYESHKPYRGGN
jgi:tetratricopeptide (TPR) repeat protein